MSFDETAIYCFIIVVILVIYHFYVDPDKDIERHYFKTSKVEHALFKLAYYIILVSLILCVRYLAYEGFASATKWLK